MSQPTDDSTDGRRPFGLRTSSDPGTAVVFPGQGSQVPAIGAAWRRHDAWEVVERAEEALRAPLAYLLLDDDPEVLAATRAVQLAVFLSSLLAWSAARDCIERPLAFAGHSLGQLTALVAAEILSLEDGVRVVASRAELTQQAARRHPGGMAALLGATLAQAEEACAAAPGACWIANDNGAGQIVIAGTYEGLTAARSRAEQLGVRRSVKLAVDGAFHTPLMAEAASAFSETVSAVSFHPGMAPVISNADAIAHEGGPAWAERLVAHLVSPVRWRETQAALVGLGTHVLLELGPGKTLSGIARRTVPTLATCSADVPSAITELIEGAALDATNAQ